MHTLRVSATAQWYHHSEIDEESGNVNTAFQLHTQTVDLLGHTKVGQVTGAVGFSGLFKQYAATGDEALTPAANSTGLGVLLYQEIPLRYQHQDPDALVPKLQVGGRFDRYQIDSKAGAEKFGPARALRFNNVSASLGITVPFTHALNLGVSAAQAFRAPSVEELFSNAFHEAAGTYDLGNPDLKSEINRGVEAVFRVEGHRVGAQFAGYYNQIKNFISPNIVGDTTIDADGEPNSVPLNRISQADATLRGVEGQIELAIASHIVLGGLGDVVRGNLQKTKEPLPFLPAARLGTSGRFDNGKFNFGLEYRHSFAQNRVPVAATPEDPSGVVAPANDLINLSAGLIFHAGGILYSLTLRADNLLDEKYVDATSRLKSFAFNPGRNLSLVSRLNF
jgi:iron complex outermembrane receptor protein